MLVTVHAPAGDEPSPQRVRLQVTRAEGEPQTHQLELGPEGDAPWPFSFDVTPARDPRDQPVRLTVAAIDGAKEPKGRGGVDGDRPGVRFAFEADKTLSLVLRMSAQCPSEILLCSQAKGMDCMDCSACADGQLVTGDLRELDADVRVSSVALCERDAGMSAPLPDAPQPDAMDAGTTTMPPPPQAPSSTTERPSMVTPVDARMDGAESVSDGEIDGGSARTVTQDNGVDTGLDAGMDGGVDGRTDGATATPPGSCDGVVCPDTYVCREVPEPTRHVCVCPAGFLADSQDRCTDVNECLGRPCSTLQTCRNTLGSYACECTGYFTPDANDPNGCTDPHLVTTLGLGVLWADGAEHVAVASDGLTAVAGFCEGACDGGDPSDPLDILVWFVRDGSKVGFAQYGGVGEQRAWTVAMDDNHAYFLSGVNDGELDFGLGVLPSYGGTDGFVAKLDRDGTARWAHAVGGAGYDAGKSLRVDSAGNVILVGYYTGPATLAGATLPLHGDKDMFIAKFTPAGELSWVRTFGGLGREQADDVALDAQGNIYLAGLFHESVIFSPAISIVSTGGEDAFIAKLSADGEPLWAHGFGGGTDDQAKAIHVGSVNGTEHLYVGGHFSGLMTLQGSVHEAYGPTDGFISRYTTDGELEWTRTYGGSDYDGVKGIATTDEGKVFVTGTMRETVIDGAIELVGTGSGDADVGLMFFDELGNTVWMQRLRNNSGAWPKRLARMPDGKFVLVGHTIGDLMLPDGSDLVGRGMGSGFLLVIDP